MKMNWLDKLLNSILSRGVVEKQPAGQGTGDDTATTAFGLKYKLSTKRQKLIYEAEKGNLENVKKLLRESPDLVLSKDIDNLPGVDSLRPSRTGTATLLHYAGLGRGTPGLAELLLANGAEVNATNEWGLTPLHFAAQGRTAGLAELLLANGAEVNGGNSVGLTPLHWAGTAGLAELLLANGADVNAAG